MTEHTSSAPLSNASVAPFSVIIPAHNEEAVIARCLNTLLEGAPADALPEIVVSANGCTDRTVTIAREIAPFATVLDLPKGSKILAMNEGNAVATAMPRIYLDADVQCSYASLLATARVLEQDGVMAASPKITMDLTHCDFFVRAYYRVWLNQPYVMDRMVGSGVFGLSREGLAEIKEFPDIFGDDIWVYTRFSYDQRRNVSEDEAGNPAYFIVSPPRSLMDHITIEARRKIGNEEVEVLHANSNTQKSGQLAALPIALKHGASVVDIAIYLGMKVASLAKYRWNKFRGKTPEWIRDTNARKLT